MPWPDRQVASELSARDAESTALEQIETISTARAARKNRPSYDHQKTNPDRFAPDLAPGGRPGPDRPSCHRPPPRPPATPDEQAIQDIKNPAPWLTWGTDLRIRNEYFDDLLSLTPNPKQSPNRRLAANAPIHEQDYFRFRARLRASVTPLDNLSLNARLATEPRAWMNPARVYTL